MFIKEINALNGTVFQEPLRFYILVVLVCIETPFIREWKALFSSLSVFRLYSKTCHIIYLKTPASIP